MKGFNFTRTGPGFASVVAISLALAACDSSPDITLLATTTPTTLPVGITAESWALQPFPGVIIPDSPGQFGALAGSAFRFVGAEGLDYSNGLWMAVGGPSALDGAQVWASNDGVIWEPRYFPEIGTVNPLGIAAFENGGWVMATGRSAAFVGGDLEIWRSSDGVSWQRAVSAPSLDIGLNPVGYATEGSTMAILFRSGGPGGPPGQVEETTSAVLLVSNDAGANWMELVLEGEPVTVVNVAGDLVAAGGSSTRPTIWRMSKAWAVEYLEGLGSVAELMSLVVMPDGTILANGRASQLDVTYSWFTSADLQAWEGTEAPPGVSRTAILGQVGEFVAATSRTNNSASIWLTTDGVEWLQMLPTDTPLAAPWLPSGVSLMATDGNLILGMTPLGFIGTHQMNFLTSQFGGEWVTVMELAEERSVWGIGSERFIVSGGEIRIVRGREIVEMAQPPSALADDVVLHVTDSALFVAGSSESWVFADDKWHRSQLPVRSSTSGVIETEDGYVMMVLEVDQVIKYRSTDGIEWVTAPVAPITGDAVGYDPLGWFLVYDDTDYRSFREAMESTVSISTDGSDWESLTLAEWIVQSTSRITARPDGTVAVATSDGEVEFPVPTGAVFHSLAWADADSHLMRVLADRQPYLVLTNGSAEEIWVPLVAGGPNLLDVWAYRTEVVGVVLESDEDGNLTTAIKIWTP